MSTPLILLTGATGKIGSCIAKHLEGLGKEFRLLARDPNKLSEFPDADKVKGDYSNVKSLDRAFTGVSSAFIVSGYAEPGERAKLPSQRVPGCAASRCPLPDLSLDIGSVSQFSLSDVT